MTKAMKEQDQITGEMVAALAASKDHQCAGGCGGMAPNGYKYCPGCQKGADILDKNAIRLAQEKPNIYYCYDCGVAQTLDEMTRMDGILVCKQCTICDFSEYPNDPAETGNTVRISATYHGILSGIDKMKDIFNQIGVSYVEDEWVGESCGQPHKRARALSVGDTHYIFTLYGDYLGFLVKDGVYFVAKHVPDDGEGEMPPEEHMWALVHCGPRVKCNKCGTVVQSQYRHDFVGCECGAIAVDGGDSYTKMNGEPKDYTVLD